MNDKHWAESLREHEQTPRPQAWERLRQRMEASQTDKIFAEKLQNLEQAPRPEAWQRLQGRLPAPTRKPTGWRWAAAAAVVLLVGWGGYQLSLPEAATLPLQQLARVQPASTPLPQHENQTAQKQDVVGGVQPAGAAESMAMVSRKEKNTVLGKAARQPRALAKADVAEPVGVQPLPTARPELSEALAARLPEVKALPEPEKEQVFVVKVVEPPVQPTENPAAATPARPRDQERKFFGRLAAGIRNVQDGNWEELGLDRRTLLTKAENSLSGKKMQ